MDETAVQGYSTYIRKQAELVPDKGWINKNLPKASSIWTCFSFLKMFPNLRRNLVIRQFIHRTDLDNTPLKPFLFEACFELALGFTRTKDLDGIGIAQIFENPGVIAVEVVPK